MVSGATVRKVAGVARLHLTEGELRKFSVELESILRAFREIGRIPVKGVKPSFQPVPVKNVMRKDSAGKSLTQGEALRNAKNKESGYFRGPKAA
jgi:aspartyl-tRNA(Asn)/glutamyl-tRNA(Gln) amidotransferase subunit C